LRKDATGRTAARRFGFSLSSIKPFSYLPAINHPGPAAPQPYASGDSRFEK